MIKMSQAESTARTLIATQTTERLIEQFEMTETMNKPETYTVRGWYMDELEKRNPTAFEEWVMSEETSPRRFFLGK